MELTYDEEPLTLPKYKSFRQIISIVLNITLGSFFFGYQMAVYNTMQVAFKMIFNLSNDQLDFYNGIITSCTPIGALFGASCASFIPRKIGLKRSFILSDIITIFGICLHFIQNLQVIIYGRLIAGFCVGFNSVLIPIFINEISPIQISGRMGSLNQSMINVGVISSFFIGLGLNLPPDCYYWRFMFGFPILTSIIRIILISLSQLGIESPKFLISEQRFECAQFQINQIYKDQFVGEIFEEVKQNMRINKETKINKKRLMIGIILFFFQQFSGANSVIFYSQHIFLKQGDTILASNIFTIIIGFVLIISALVSGKVVDKYGRKMILIYGSIACMVFLFILAFSNTYNVNFLSKVSIIFFLGGFGVSLGPVIWIYLPEILNAKGVSISSFFNWIFTAVIGLGFPIFQRKLGISLIFLFFSFCCLISSIFVWKFVPETKGRSPQNIARNFGEKIEDE